MAGLELQERFEVSSSGITFEQLAKDAPEELANSINETGVFILPSHETKDSFYTGSLDTLDYLNDNGLKADIYTNDEDYKELGLHAADIWLGTFFVKNIVIPVFCGVIASYIYEKLKAKKDDKISVKFIVEKKDGKSSAVSFDGKVEEMEKALNAVKVFSNDD
ncbi:hypothetical protein P3W43_04950 [Salinicola salarius]|uniref:hypothetical protein n=1 Tax=Salinicola salarius TaxID=430457 RepID=UPI0023E3A448|nr:hypothetical protein [Salinicola salarius]MDF3918207.1 hypothetical protein [Salinicola salarius]